jgi:hypothetical protein
VQVALPAGTQVAPPPVPVDEVVDEVAAPPVEVVAPPVDEAVAPPVDEVVAPPVEVVAPPLDEVVDPPAPPAPVDEACPLDEDVPVLEDEGAAPPPSEVPGSMPKMALHAPARRTKGRRSEREERRSMARRG